MMKQNIYDDPDFFNGYRTLRDNESGLNAAVEEPAVASVLPDPKGQRILDLGCGFGDFCRELRAMGAKHVSGVELSAKMLAVAERETNDDGIVYYPSAIEDFVAESGSFDLITARLVMHYVADYKSVMAKISDFLTVGGTFIMSFEHPMCTALLKGWCYDEAGEIAFWPVDHYQDEGIRQHHWFVEGVVKYHRTLATYLNVAIAAGLTIKRILEPKPLEKYLVKRPELEQHNRRPPIVVLVAMKN